MNDVTFRRPIHWSSTALTDVGCVRKVNEDTVVDMGIQRLWAVADGMGGHQVGDVASQKIAAVLAKVYPHAGLSNYVDAVEDALLEVNDELIQLAQASFDNQTMGSTAVCLVIKNHVGVCLWVGDSRLYRLRNYKLQKLTRDHSQVEEMVQMGMITPQEAETHPHKNVITRAVGVEHDLFVDINVFSTQVGDTFLLCSDGLYNAVPEHSIAQLLVDRSTQVCGEELMETALANEARDNVSLIVIKGEPGRV